MRKVLSPIEVRDKLGRIIEEAYYTGKQFIIARRGKPMAAIVPISEYEKWEREREEFFALIDKVWKANREVDPDTLAQDVAQAVRETREGVNAQSGA
ncbi:MAG TPA: type II toxin-antitoxin system Phd/YefM family antitoxin [Firmicutes bacterium]|nr:type II toxin-antitoxin system Phd/YefM family antitoxin [Candidatus Fermentithermobacillaceae bacterium]